MKIRKPKSSVSYDKLVIFLYLFPIFISTFDIGPGGKFPLRLHILLYPMIIIFSVLKDKVNKRIILISIGSVFLVLIYMPVYLTNEFSNYISGYLKAIFVIPVFVFCTLLVRELVLKDFSIFEAIFDKFCYFSIGLVYLSFVIYFITGNYFLADDGYGYFRPHALFSEPSAMSFVMAYGVCKNFFNNKFFKSIIFIVASILTGSLISLLSCFLVIFLYLIKKERIIVKTLALSLSFIIINYGIFFIVNYSPDSNSLISSQLSRLRSGIIAVINFNSSGYNPRLNTFIDLINYLFSHFNYSIFGFGPLSDTFLPFGSVASSASSLPFAILFNFGFLGLAVYSLWLITTFFINQNGRSVSYLSLYCSLVFVTAVNSAQGILIFQLLFLVAMVKDNEKGTYFRSRKRSKKIFAYR